MSSSSDALARLQAIYNDAREKPSPPTATQQRVAAGGWPADLRAAALVVDLGSEQALATAERFMSNGSAMDTPYWREVISLIQGTIDGADEP